MKNLFASLVTGSMLLSFCSTFAADAKTYQVTGPVLSVTPTTITVQKGDEKWEIARTKNTKFTNEPKVGTKVTIYYSMIATEIEVKESKGKASETPSKTGK